MVAEVELEEAEKTSAEERGEFEPEKSGELGEVAEGIVLQRRMTGQLSDALEL